MVLQNQHSEVLSVDVAKHMNFSKPSVCHAVKQLKGKGFLDVYEDGILHLTEEGRKLAEGVYERHRFFTEYLMEMGASAKQAEEDACKMKHIISEESFRALKMGRKTEHFLRICTNYEYCVNNQMEIAKNVQNAYIIYKQSNDNIIIVSKYE